MKNVKIGFLPLFIKLYDDSGSGKKTRPRLEPFYEKLALGLEARGLEVIRSPFCRTEAEFAAAVEAFEKAGADAIVTWHAAYSPSLECAAPLSGTKLPIVVLDTTEVYDFSPEAAEPTDISLCHGIHGVMDMCNLLRRNGKAYAIAAGHIDHSDVLDRAAGYVRAASAASSLAGSRVGSIGGSFDGMGDFLVSDDDIKSRFGVDVVYPEKGELARLCAGVSDADIEKELAFDGENYYEIEPVSRETHIRTVRASLAVREWIASRSLDAFTANFREIHPAEGLEIMPFMEACKAMSRGVGYAGEGDVMTAALSGALMKAYPDSGFIEIFCPDWKGNRLLISHMGEYNPRLIKGKAGIKEIDFIFGDAKNPVVSYGAYKAGDAVFVNLFRDEKGFRMLLSDITVTGEDDKKFESKVRGWIKPRLPVSEFLEKLSAAGAIHHSVVVYGAKTAELEYFARLLGLECETV